MQGEFWRGWVTNFDPQTGIGSMVSGSRRASFSRTTCGEIRLVDGEITVTPSSRSKDPYAGEWIMVLPQKDSKTGKFFARVWVFQEEFDEFEYQRMFDFYQTILGFSSSTPPAWQKVLEIPNGVHVTPEILKTYYRRASKKHHPDVGGSAEAMRAVNIARSMAEKELGFRI